MRKYDDIYLERTFAERLRTTLDENLITAEDLEDAGIVNAGHVSRYLNGSALPQLRTAFHIAEFLGVSLDWLCGLN